MNKLTLGSRGPDVIKLQNFLMDVGYTTITTDGIFGENTRLAVLDYQKQQGLVVDGIVGSQTMNLLNNPYAVKGNVHLTQVDIENAAKRLNVEVACLMSVIEVETKNTGFYLNNKPIILFERHQFYKCIKNKSGGNKAIEVFSNNPNICNRLPGGYGNEGIEWDRLTRARVIDNDSALMSASYGLFQILGLNYDVCGFKDVNSFFDSMCVSEGNQLDIFVNFLLHSRNKAMLLALRNHNWQDFARLYNGSNYQINDYDTKLFAAYRRYSNLHN